jgi:hypothetical protein
LNNSFTPKQWSLAAVLLLAAVLSVLPVVDQQAKENYESLFQRAFVTFALARTLNGVISAVQGTELALQPAGVGVTLTPGEILDPVNDLIERFSWIMLGATVSLGIQNVLMDVSAWWLIKLLGAGMSLWVLLAMFSARGTDGSRRLLTRVLLVALFLRFAVPLTLIANDALYQLFLEPRYVESTEVVRAAGEEIEQLGQADDASQDEDEGGLFSSGILGSVGDAMERTRNALDLGEKMGRIRDRAGEMIEHLIQLSVVFILQTGILPLVFLWLFLQLAKLLFRPVGIYHTDK